MSRDVLLAEAEALYDQVVAWRRALHQRPEVGFHEHETARFLREQLTALGGLEVSRPTDTSVLAVLRTGRPGPVLALRADIDALPIHEENDVAYRSLHDGVMHACGHDGHTAMLLGVATVLVRHRARLAGEVRFIFQHAEEVSPGGAEALVQRGVMDGVEAVLGVHLWASLPVGRVALIPGPAMAAPDTFEITIEGQGGHAAIPQDTIDPVAIGALVVTGLQHIAARMVDPLEPVVVSVTQFHAGTASNVIPNRAVLGGTVRTFDAALRARVPQLIDRLVQGTCAAHGARGVVRHTPGYRPVVNDPPLTARLAEVVREVLGEGVLAAMRPSMGGEDFSAYQQRAPGVFAFVGAGNAAVGADHPHHHPRFQVDEASLGQGMAYLLAATHALLADAPVPASA